jgi:hypothetical protein
MRTAAHEISQNLGFDPKKDETTCVSPKSRKK